MAHTVRSTASYLIERGMACARQGSFGEAAELFDRAVREAGLEAMPPRVLASYGLARVASRRGRASEALEICELAVARAPVDPVVYHLHVEACLRARSKSRALKALEAGLGVDPDHAGLLRSRSKLGRRRPPVLRFLPRGNLLNKALGRLRHRLSQGREPTNATRA